MDGQIASRLCQRIFYHRARKTQPPIIAQHRPGTGHIVYAALRGLRQAYLGQQLINSLFNPRYIIGG